MNVSSLVRIARRRGWVVVLAIVAGVAGAVLFSALQPTAYRAGATLLVATDDSFNSSRLASTYAAALPDDGGLLREISGALDVDVEEVPDSLTVEAEDETAVMRLEYSAATQSDALRGARVAVEAMTGSRPAALSVPPDVLEVVREARVTSTPASGVSTTSLVLGGILGLFLGAVLAAGLERSDRRVESTQDLRLALGGLPVTAVADDEALTPALLERWRELSRTESALVAVIPAHGVDARGLERLADRVPAGADERHDDLPEAVPAGTGGRPASLQGHASRGGRSRAGSLSAGGDGAEAIDSGAGIRLVVGGPLGTDGRAEMVAQTSDLTVLAVRRGTRERDIESDVAVLEQYGVTPSWALLTG